MGWAGPAQLTGPNSAPKGLGRSQPNKKISYFCLGQTWPRQQGWARVSLAHKHIRTGPEPVWPSERNPSVLGQNRPGPALDNQPGGNYFPPSSCMQNVRSACRKKTQTTKRNKGGRKVYLVRRKRCPAGRTASLVALWWRPVAVSLLTNGGSKQ